MPFRIRRGTFGAAVFLLAVIGLISGTLWYSRSSHSTHSVAPAAAAHAAGVDFSQQGDANLAAAQGNLWSDLPKFASYAGAQIVSYGIEVDLVGAPTAAILAVVARDDPQYQGKPVPVRYRAVRYSQQQLQALLDRVEADDKELRQQGIELNTWGIDINSNTGQVSMTHYTKAYQDVLLARYGSELSVVPHDVETSNG